MNDEDKPNGAQWLLCEECGERIGWHFAQRARGWCGKHAEGHETKVTINQVSGNTLVGPIVPIMSPN